MRIAIAQKLRPFSHRPGTRCLIPFTTWEVQIFPAKLFFFDHATRNTHQHSPPIEGPVTAFTILLDLEKCRIEVFGKAANGYFRYFIAAEEASFPFLKKMSLPPTPTRLSLGIHKKQDWDLIQRRQLMEEILPFWFRLAQIIPPTPFYPTGTGKLLAAGELDLTFQAAFQGILCPCLSDENHLGLIPDEKITPQSPLGIIHEGARQIQALFFSEGKNSWNILPNLPKEFHAGRLTALQTSTGDTLDIEWSKKQLQKGVIHSTTDHQIALHLQSKIKSFRLRRHLRQKGEQLPNGATLSLPAHSTIYLDRFKH